MLPKFFLVIFLLFFLNSFPFIWKGKQQDLASKENNWIYVKDKDSRTIAFLEFENYTKNRAKDFDSFKESLPRLIAKQFRSIKELDVPENDFVASPENQNKYKIFKLPFEDSIRLFKKYGDFLNKTQFEASKIFGEEIALTNAVTISTTNAISENTNTINQNQLNENNEENQDNATSENTPKEKESLEKKIADFLTQTKVAYIETNENEYVFYGYNGSPLNYVDANLISEQNLTNITVPIYTNANGIKFFVFREKGAKKLILDEKLYSFNIPLNETIKKVGANYLVYGKYEVRGINFFLDIFVINKAKATIEKIYSKKIRNSVIRKEARNLSQYIIGYLEKKELVNNVSFTSNPKGASLYLDGKFQGKLPLTFPVLVKKKYQYEIYLEKNQLSTIETDFPGDRQVIDVDRSNGKVVFNLDSLKDKGGLSKLNVFIDNEIPSDFYFNTDLIGHQQTTFSRDLEPGNYHLTVTNANFLTKNFKITIPQSEDLDIHLNMHPNQKNSVHDFFFNHSRNVKIFSILGFLLGTSGIAIYFQALDYEDRRNEVDRRLNEVSSTSIGYNNLEDYRGYLTKEYNSSAAISLGLLGGSLVSFLGALFSHYFDVWEGRIKIETEMEHSPDTKFIYKTSIKF